MFFFIIANTCVECKNFKFFLCETIKNVTVDSNKKQPKTGQQNCCSVPGCCRLPPSAEFIASKLSKLFASFFRFQIRVQSLQKQIRLYAMHHGGFL